LLTRLSAALAAMLALNLLSCDRAPKAAPHGPEPRHVLATVYPVADIAKQVGGTRVVTEWFIESGDSLDPLETSPERRNTTRVSDLVISRGPSETWMLGEGDDPYGARRIIRLEKFPAAQNAAPQALLWLDPDVAKELSTEIVKRLAAVDPLDEQYFKDNCAKFQQEVDALCDDARKKLAAIPEKNFLCTTPAFSSFVLRFGVIEALAAVEPTTELSPERIRGMRNVARGLRAKALFVPIDTPPGVQRDLSDKVGVQVLTLDPLGTSAPSGRNTYLKLLRYNLEQLVAGLGGESPAESK
jgi:zinc transport system substrate-binding protein